MTKQTRLIIARHGNTFNEGETPRRVGIGTDLPLSASGEEQALALGRHLKDNNILPDAVFCSHLMRTRQTAALAMAETGQDMFIQAEGFFNEIDYGPDQIKTEDEVIARIGKDAIAAWDGDGTVPPGWNFDPTAIIEGWRDFASRVAASYPGCTILAVTSNGIARFAPYLTGDFESFRKKHDIKLKTGAFGIVTGTPWTIETWNKRP